MQIVKAFKDAAQVASDVASVLARYADVPAAVSRAGWDALSAIRHRDPALLATVIDDVKTARQVIEADTGAASSEFAALEADLQTLAADFS